MPARRAARPARSRTGSRPRATPRPGCRGGPRRRRRSPRSGRRRRGRPPGPPARPAMEPSIGLACLLSGVRRMRDEPARSSLTEDRAGPVVSRANGCASGCATRERLREPWRRIGVLIRSMSLTSLRGRRSAGTAARGLRIARIGAGGRRRPACGPGRGRAGPGAAGVRVRRHRSACGGEVVVVGDHEDRPAGGRGTDGRRRRRPRTRGQARRSARRAARVPAAETAARARATRRRWPPESRTPPSPTQGVVARRAAARRTRRPARPGRRRARRAGWRSGSRRRCSPRWSRRAATAPAGR